MIDYALFAVLLFVLVALLLVLAIYFDAEPEPYCPFCRGYCSEFGDCPRCQNRSWRN